MVIVEQKGNKYIVNAKALDELKTILTIAKMSDFKIHEGFGMGYSFTIMKDDNHHIHINMTKHQSIIEIKVSKNGSYFVDERVYRGYDNDNTIDKPFKKLLEWFQQ